MDRLLAASADEDRLAGFNPEHRDEKNAQIVVHPLEIGLMQSAPWAAPGGFVQGFDLGLEAPDKEKKALDHGDAPRRYAGIGASITSCRRIFIDPALHTTLNLSRQAGPKRRERKNRHRLLSFGGFVLDRQYELVY
jgi:hypothetical protein